MANKTLQRNCSGVKITVNYKTVGPIVEFSSKLVVITKVYIILSNISNFFD